MLHMLHLLSVIRAACITGEHDWGLQIYNELKARIDSSPIKRSAYLVYLLRVNHARLQLNHHVASGKAGPAPLTEADFDWLKSKAPVPFRKAAPLRLRARVAAMSGDRQRAIELLEATRQAHAEIGAVDDAERDRYALGLITEAEQLMAAAANALRNMGVSSPEREIDAYYPELTKAFKSTNSQGS
ncbi:MAG TPA: hypothetical protein VMF89_07505 [Polyangiales bacterium]|nr:hypothetical protein [Polyangiales bacterium]